MKEGIIRTTIALCACGILGAGSAEHAAHVHGEARLDVAQEGAMLSLQLESPLDNLLGFEHAPKNAAEEDQAKRMSAKLRAAGDLFALPPAADCVLEKVTLESSVLTPGWLGETEDERAHEHEHEHAHESEEGHADLDVLWQFHCAYPESLRSVEVRLFGAFPGLRELKVQAATPGGQRGATLTPQERTLTW